MEPYQSWIFVHLCAARHKNEGYTWVLIVNSDPPPPPTAVQGKMHGFRGVPYTGQNYNFLKRFFCPCFGPVPILELWQFWHQPIGPPKPEANKKSSWSELSTCVACDGALRDYILVLTQLGGTATLTMAPCQRPLTTTNLIEHSRISRPNLFVSIAV